MIYTTKGITKTKMNIENNTGTPSEDFSFLLHYNPLRVPLEWAEKKAAISGNFTSKAKKDGYYFLAGTLLKDGEEFKRGNSYLIDKTLIVLDLDETDLTLSQVKAVLEKTIGNYNWLLYPTASHTLEKTKLRIIIEPVRPMIDKEYGFIVDEVQVKTGLDLDPASSNWAQHMGMPILYEGLEDVFKIYHNKGEPYPINPMIENRRATQRIATGKVLEGTRNTTMFKLASSFQAKGISDVVISDMIKAENMAKCDPPLPDTEVDNIVESALKYEKGSSEEIIKSREHLSVIEKDGKYQKVMKNKDVQYLKPISNFTIMPSRLIKCIDFAGEDILEVTIVLDNGESSRHNLNSRCFDDVGKFSEAISSFHTMFIGSREDLQSIKLLLSNKNTTTIRGFKVGGMHKIGTEWVFVTEKGSLRANGTFDNEIIQLKNDGIKTAILDRDPITKEELEIIGRYLFDFNNPSICSCIMGYLGSIFLKERLYSSSKVKYPHLMISGEAGSGKSETLENIIIPILSIKGSVNSSSGITKFTADKMACSNNTLPFALEEYKPCHLNKDIVDVISNLARCIYDRQSSSRGNKDRSLEEYILLAPMLLVGEASITETAINERSQLLTFSKKDSIEKKASFLRLRGRDSLASFGRSLLDKSLSITDVELKTIYNSYFEDLTKRGVIKVDRIRSSTAVILIGIDMINRVFNDLGLDFERETGLTINDIIEIVVKNVIDDNLNGNESTKAMVDSTLELMSRALSSMTTTESNSLVCHLHKEPNLLGLRLKELHPIMTKYAKDYNIQEKYLTISDLTRQIKKAPYFIARDGKYTHKVNVTKGDKITSYMVAIIDLNEAKVHGLELDGFVSYMENNN